ncbi:MAG: YcbK family protein [Methylococcales bacterium]|nr:YcbK family protein [Methylococcales bacterium]
MQSLTLENLAAGDKEILSSRRKFLTNLACGSLLFLAGTGIASARAKHFAARKTVQKSSGKTTRIATKSHQKLKNTISNRLAKKSGHVHEQLAAHHSHGNHHKHSKHSRIQLASHKPTRSRLYRDDAVVLDTYEDRQYFARQIPSKMISLQNSHTGDRLHLTYFERGLYIEDALQEIDYVLRDYHTGDIHPIDPALLDQLYDLKLRLGVSRPFNVISGYRSPETNANLRRHGDGVAKHSLHMQGRAVDIRLHGYDASTIRDAALSMQRGGVGYYSASNFVHLDTGDVRTWGA